METLLDEGDITRMLTEMKITELPRLQQSVRQLLVSNDGQLTNIDLSGLCLRHIPLKNAVLVLAVLEDADLTRADLRGVEGDFRGTILLGLTWE